MYGQYSENDRVDAAPISGRSLKSRSGNGPASTLVVLISGKPKKEIQELTIVINFITYSIAFPHIQPLMADPRLSTHGNPFTDVSVSG